MSENVLFNGKDYFIHVISIPTGNSFSSAFFDIFLHFSERSSSNCDINILQNIGDIIIFKIDNFKCTFSLFLLMIIVKRKPVW